MYPLLCRSWTILSSEIAIKRVDKSCISYNETGIPKEICSFFNIPKNIVPFNIDISIIYNRNVYKGTIQVRKTNAKRAKMKWDEKLTEEINIRYPHLEKRLLPYKQLEDRERVEMIFTRININSYELYVQEKKNYHEDSESSKRSSN